MDHRKGRSRFCRASMCPTDGPVLGLLWIVAVGLTRAWFAVAPPGATNRRRRRCCRRRAVRQLQALLFLVAFCPSYAAPPMPQAGARDAHCQNVPVPGLQNDVEVSAHQELVVDNLADSFRSKHHLVDDLQFNGPQKRPRSLYCGPVCGPSPLQTSPKTQPASKTKMCP